MVSKRLALFVWIVFVAATAPLDAWRASPQNAELLDRFKQEAQAAGQRPNHSRQLSS